MLHFNCQASYSSSLISNPEQNIHAGGNYLMQSNVPVCDPGSKALYNGNTTRSPSIARPAGGS